MSTGRVIAYMAAWFVASVTIALVFAILVVEVLRVFGIAESGTASYRVALNLSFLVLLSVLIAVPFVFRRRFNRYEPPPPDA